MTRGTIGGDCVVVVDKLADNVAILSLKNFRKDNVSCGGVNPVGSD